MSPDGTGLGREDEAQGREPRLGGTACATSTLGPLGRLQGRECRDVPRPHDRGRIHSSTSHSLSLRIQYQIGRNSEAVPISDTLAWLSSIAHLEAAYKCEFQKDDIVRLLGRWSRDVPDRVPIQSDTPLRIAG